jgi:ATP-binding cassette subfamily B (MDR/TAP) protein 1
LNPAYHIQYTTEQFFICLMAVIFGATSAGLVFAYAPDFSQASMSATRLKGLVSRSPEIDCWSSEGDVVKHAAGDLSFSDASFTYATRPELPALSSVNLKAPSGGSIAFCGPSGSGKSTIIALSERFYDVNNGSVDFDGANIRSLNLNSYRAQIALVSQAPLLFSGSLRENLLLGSLNNDATEADLIESCKMANIWDFVASLPEGLETLCGSNAALLSGGQKQRLSIA